VDGFLIINNAGATVNVSGTDVCKPTVQVLLYGNGLAQQPWGQLSCPDPPLSVDPGTTRIPIQIITSYEGCSAVGPGSKDDPPCRSPDSLPPLPAGVYSTKVVWSGDVDLPQPGAVTITLVS